MAARPITQIELRPEEQATGIAIDEHVVEEVRSAQALATNVNNSVGVG